jgi:hypothetical protein
MNIRYIIKEYKALNCMQKVNHSKVFWVIVVLAYVTSILLSYYRVYVKKSYPIFYTEDEIPGVFDPINSFLQ